jgi:integrase
MKYRRRMPRALLEYVDKKEIIKVVKSKEEAVSIDTKIENALKVAQSNFTDATKRVMIEEELGIYVKLKPLEEAFRYSDAVKLYLEQSQVSEREEKNRDYFFNELLPNLLRFVFEKNPVTANITSSHLNEIASIMQKLPSRNHLNLKRISTYEIITNAIKGEYKDSKKLHIDTVNKNIKRIRSLALFGFKTGLFTMTTAIATVKHQYSARDQRKALTYEEIELITNATPNQEIRDFITILRYTGMRIGELHKYKIKIIDGIECFDLREAESLKTMSSFRVIPKHPKINTVEFSYSLEHLSRQVKHLIDENLEDSDKKTTYSLRHTFASELIVRSVGSDIVSELLGHKHIGMTLSRYAKGFSVEQLRKAIVTL